MQIEAVTIKIHSYSERPFLSSRDVLILFSWGSGSSLILAIEMKRTGTLPPAGNVKPNLEVMPSLFTQRKTRFVPSLKTKGNMQALKTSPKGGKVHFPPHF